jgi:hypothetical protein
MLGVCCTVRLYVTSTIAPFAYMFYTFYLYVLFSVALCAYMFDRPNRGQKLTESCGKTPIAPSTYMLVHALPICFVGKWEKSARRIAPSAYMFSESVFMIMRWSRWRAFAAMTSDTKLGWAVSV